MDLVAGATGTGKTITLQSMAETFSSIGVPVVMADVKGDLSGIAKAGGGNPKVAARIQELKYPGTHTHGFSGLFLGYFWRTGTSAPDNHF